MNSFFDHPPLIKVKLLGKLGQKFGRVIYYHAHSTLDVIQGICANRPSFANYIYALEDQGYGYRVIRGKRIVQAESELADPVAAEELAIAPIQAGSGGFFTGVGSILAGAALLGVGILTGNVAVGLAGASLIFSGFSSLFSKKQTTPSTDTERSQSFLFDTTSRGDNSNLAVVPICYGEKFRQLTENDALSLLIETHKIAIDN